jgi:hypothetical protein
MNTRALPAVAAVATAMVFATGCGPTNADGQETTTMSTEQVEEALHKKPPFEAAQTEYKTAVADMANQIAALSPGLKWSISDDSWLACDGDYIKTDAKHVYLMAGFDGPIPDAVWPNAVQIVKNGAGKLGATQVGTVKDEPGNHDMFIAGPDGIEFRFGTNIKSSLTARSDCRLPSAK